VLIISRKESESIRIEPAAGLDPSLTLRDLFRDGSIVVRLARVSASRVRLAIEAPILLKVRREEPEASRE
jgi:sRNA-binding carbon storage regulator CsrA